jgi:hypothetical protein
MKSSETTVLDLEKLPPSCVLTTRDAALVLNRSQQTLRKWACYESGPLRPIRINGRLGWRVGDVLSLLKGGAA